MKTVLLIGTSDYFSKNLIEKLFIKKWRIYTLVNSKKIAKPAHVFEQYVFDYSSDSVKEIIKGCRPDVILFTGAYDSAYKWDEKNTKDTTLQYIADLSNVLIFSAMQGINHFIYLSSEDVFEDDYIVDIKEEMNVSPNSYKGTAISQGENMTLHMGQSKEMNVTIVRLANMYGIPTDIKGCNDVCTKMSVEALINGKLVVNAKKIFSVLYVRDAVEAVFILMEAPERKHKLYHISSMEEITEYNIAKIINENCSNPLDIIDCSKGLNQRRILSNERFLSEFTYDIRNSYIEIIPKIISYINKHKKRFINVKDEDKKSDDRHHWLRLIKKVFPYLECMVFFVPIFLLSHGIIGSKYLEGINFYLLYVLLYALVYGKQLSVFASLLSVIGYSVSHMINSSAGSLIIDVTNYVYIVQIFIVGLTVGHLKDKFIETSDDMNDEVQYLKDQLKDIMTINSSNKKIKDYYADKVISSKEGIGKIYGITSKLQKSEKGEVLFAALDTLKEIMETQEVSIYLVSNKNYCRLASASGIKSTSLGKSISINTHHIIFDELRLGKVFINRSLDPDLPMMASALFDDDKNMRIVIFLWDLPYERMTLYYSNLLSVVGALVYSVFVSDANYLDALIYRRYIADTSILQEDAFKEMIDIYRRAGEKGYSESSLLYIQKEGRSNVEINNMIKPLLRETDYIGMMPKGELAILLTNSTQNDSVFVRERLEKAKIKTSFGYIVK